MAIDLSALRKKLNQITGVSSKKNISWRPEEGQDYQVRLLSFPNNDGQPFKELMFYYNIGNNAGLLAPYQFNKPDPIQELIGKLRDEGTKESYELAKKLYPKMRCYAPVVVRGEEDKGVRIWSFGKTLYQNLLNIMLDEDYGDITDPEHGRDIKVSVTKPPGKTYADTKVTPRASQTPLSKDAAQMKQWLSSIPRMEDYDEHTSPEEIEKRVNDWIAGGSTSEKPEARTEATSSAVSADLDSEIDSLRSSGGGKAKSKSKALDDLDDAFADLE